MGNKGGKVAGEKVEAQPQASPQQQGGTSPQTAQRTASKRLDDTGTGGGAGTSTSSGVEQSHSNRGGGGSQRRFQSGESARQGESGGDRDGSSRRQPNAGPQAGAASNGSMRFTDSLNIDSPREAADASASQRQAAAEREQRAKLERQRSERRRQKQKQREEEERRQRAEQERLKRERQAQQQQREEQQRRQQQQQRPLAQQQSRSQLAAPQATPERPPVSRDFAGTTSYGKSARNVGASPAAATFDNERFRKANSMRRTNHSASTRTFRPTFAARQAAYNSNTFSLHSTVNSRFGSPDEAATAGAGAAPSPPPAVHEHPETDPATPVVRSILTDGDEDLMDDILNDI